MGHNRKQTAPPFMAFTRIRLGKNFLTLLQRAAALLQMTTMSASGHKLTSRQVRVTSALPLKADIRSVRSACQLGANNRHRLC